MLLTKNKGSPQYEYNLVPVPTRLWLALLAIYYDAKAYFKFSQHIPGAQNIAVDALS